MEIRRSDVKTFQFSPPHGVTITLISKRTVSVNIQGWMKSNNIPKLGENGFMPLATTDDGIDWGLPFLSVFTIIDLFNEQQSSAKPIDARAAKEEDSN